MDHRLIRQSSILTLRTIDEVNMRNCFVCETPYQVFNCLNIVLSQPDQYDCCNDIYIGNMFSSYNKLAASLATKRIFDHVFAYNYQNAKKNPIIRLQLMLSPLRYVKHLVEDTIGEIYCYDNVFVSTLSNMAIAMVLGSPNAKVCFYDDGAGSYVSDVGMNLITPLKVKMMKLFRINIKRFEPKVMYLNNPDMFIQGWNVEKRKLSRPDINDKHYLEILCDVFGAIPDCYNNRSIILLTQPIVSKDPELRKTQESLVDNLLSCLYSDFITVRVHPSDKSDAYVNHGFNVDDSQVLWEYICSTKIDDESVLIGSSSTALFSPKLLYNKEPTLLIVSGLLQLISNSDVVDQMLIALKERYTDPGKIIFIEDYDQLKNILDSFLHR